MADAESHKKNETALIIVIDTREQRPFYFNLPSVTAKLDAGDYSVKGYESIAAVERKSLNDLISSITFGRERFKRELQRLSGYRLKAVVIEGSMSDVAAGRYIGNATPQSVIGTCAAFLIDYGVPFIFCGDRRTAADYTERLLRKFWERETGQRVRPTGASAAPRSAQGAT